MHYPVHKRMRANYVKAANRRYTTHRATPSEDAQLRLATLHLVDPRVDPASMSRDILTLRDIATFAKTKSKPKNKHYQVTLGVVDQGSYEQM